MELWSTNLRYARNTGGNQCYLHAGNDRSCHQSTIKLDKYWAIEYPLLSGGNPTLFKEHPLETFTTIRGSGKHLKK